MKYIVRITETLVRTVIVDAENEQDAEDKVYNAYDDAQIVLDYKDFEEYEIETLRKATDFDNSFYDKLEVEE